MHFVFRFHSEIEICVYIKECLNQEKSEISDFSWFVRRKPFEQIKFLICSVDIKYNKNPNPLPTGTRFGFDCFGGPERDRTADLLNAIDGRSRVHQGQALQKEKPLKYRDFRVFAVFAHFTFLLHARLIFEIDCFLRGCVTAPFLLLCGRMCWASSLTLSWRRWR